MHNRLKAALAPKRPDAPVLTLRQQAQVWWRACRPPFFIVDFIPVGLGFALAARDLGYWPWELCLLVLLGCFFLHTVANIANDLFDYLEGVDTEETIGGTHVIQNGWISPRQISLAIIGLIIGTVVVGGWLIANSGQTWLWGPVAFADSVRRILCSPSHSLRVPWIGRAFRMPEHGIHHGGRFLRRHGQGLFSGRSGARPARGIDGRRGALLSEPAGNRNRPCRGKADACQYSRQGKGGTCLPAVVARGLDSDA